MIRTLPLLLLLLSSALFAQTPAYTTSVTFGCNQNVCNGVPLDQGGTWQFIEANQAFSIYSNGFFVFGNPGNPGSGGMSSIVDQIPQPPLRKNGSVGAVGTITFNWAAVNSDRSLHYTGHVVVEGQRVGHVVGRGSYYAQLVVDDAQLYIDSVQ
jgi:hypothetical protein